MLSSTLEVLGADDIGLALVVLTLMHALWMPCSSYYRDSRQGVRWWMMHILPGELRPKEVIPGDKISSSQTDYLLIQL